MHHRTRVFKNFPPGFQTIDMCCFKGEKKKIKKGEPCDCTLSFSFDIFGLTTQNEVVQN